MLVPAHVVEMCVAGREEWRERTLPEASALAGNFRTSRKRVDFCCI